MEYDELMSKDEMLKGLTTEFDNIHDHLREMRTANVRDRKLKPHKVANYVKDTLIDYVKNYKPDYMQGENNDKADCNECNIGGHVPTKIAGYGLYQCELCSSTFTLIEIGEFQ